MQWRGRGGKPHMQKGKDSEDIDCVEDHFVRIGDTVYESIV
jgi:hypothetical protein